MLVLPFVEWFREEEDWHCRFVNDISDDGWKEANVGVTGKALVDTTIAEMNVQANLREIICCIVVWLR